jgi:hypothetical protein
MQPGSSGYCYWNKHNNGMAKPCPEVILALRATAKQLESSSSYEWGHMGACNCGFLAQTVTSLKKEEIHRRAMQGRGDWNEQLNDYCPTSGLPMDDLISELLHAGFDSEDLKHLERLSSPTVLRSLPLGSRDFHHNIKADVVQYLRAWAALLEMQWLTTIDGVTLLKGSTIREAEKEYSPLEHLVD